MKATRPPRDRIVYAAAQSVRERGVSGTALRDVVTRAQAPRGSLQHYFPGGKDQLVSEALVWSGDFAAAFVDQAAEAMRQPTPSGLFAAMAGQWRDEFTRRGYGRGCPLVAAAADVAGPEPSLRSTINVAFERWIIAVRDALKRMGVPAPRARSLAVLMIASLEGAIVLARAAADTGPLRTIVRELQPLLDSAVS